MEENLFCFIKILIKNNNEVEIDAKELELISNSKKEEKNKKNLQKRQIDTWLTKNLTTACPFISGSHLFSATSACLFCW